MSLHYKLGPAQYWEYEYGLLLIQRCYYRRDVFVSNSVLRQVG